MTSKQIGQTWRQIEEMEKRMRGDELETPFIVLMRICRDYVATTKFPGENTMKYARERLIERLDKFRIKDFEKI